MSSTKRTTMTYLNTLRKVYPHLSDWKDSDIIDLCLMKKLEEAKE